MTATLIENIYNDYRAANEYSPDCTIEFFSKNAILFNNITKFRDESELNFYIQLLWQYLNALYKKGRFNNAADIAIKHLNIIDGEIERLNLVQLKDDWYYGILFIKGMALYELRDFKISTPVFKQLVGYDSKNENYKNWLNYSLYGQRLWISHTISIVCLALILLEIFIGHHITSFFALSLDGIAFAGIFSTMVYDYYIKRSFRKTKLK